MHNHSIVILCYNRSYNRDIKRRIAKIVTEKKHRKNSICDPVRYHLLILIPITKYID